MEIQWQFPHSAQHMNTGNVIQIEAPDFDPDIDEGLPTYLPDQDIEQNTPVLPTRSEINLIEIPQLESDLEEEEQFKDLQTYLTHHSTYQESQNIHKDYRKRLLDLDNNRYYQEIDRTYETYGPTQDYIPVNQAPGPRCMTQELIQTFSRGRGQARREELHAHRPFGAWTRSLQSRIQRKIKITQCMRQRYASIQ